jgi:DeoR/GlpR family transcriptional regulator of sugar metabolism
VQKEIISSTRRRFVVADNSKFQPMAFMQTASFDQLSGIITNQELDQNTISQVKQANVELVLV